MGTKGDEDMLKCCERKGYLVMIVYECWYLEKLKSMRKAEILERILYDICFAYIEKIPKPELGPET